MPKTKKIKKLKKISFKLIAERMTTRNFFKKIK